VSTTNYRVAQRAPAKQSPKQCIFKIAHHYNAVYGNSVCRKFPLNSFSLRFISNGTQRRADLISDNPNCTPSSLPASTLNLHWYSPVYCWAPRREHRWQGASLAHSLESVLCHWMKGQVERPTAGTINLVTQGQSTDSRIACRWVMDRVVAAWLHQGPLWQP
jgi:hypothetical protein